MNEMDLRALLIQFQDCLSDVDRCRLHFFFGDQIPRQIRDDSSINGTLHLLQTLFDRGLIHPDDLSYLIKAFQQIHRHDLSQRLQEYVQRRENPWKSMSLENERNEIDEDKICSFHGQEKGKTQWKSMEKNDEIPSILLHGEDQMEQKKKNRRHCQCLILFNVVSVVMIIGLMLMIVVEKGLNSSSSRCSSPCENRLKSPMNRIVLSYFLSWWKIERNFSLINVRGDDLTHVNFAFAMIDLNGSIALNGTKLGLKGNNPSDPMLSETWKEWIRFKRKFQHLKTLISVGGDTYEERFKTILVNNQSRSRFASSCVKFLKKFSFDGIDLDWRHPLSDSWPNHSGSLQDKRRNFILLLKEIRRQLNFHSKSNERYLFTLATGVNPDHIHQLGLSEIIEYVDWINVITYDFHHTHESQTNHNSPLYSNENESLIDPLTSSYRSKLNVHSAIQSYIQSGVPSSMLTMGIPLYGSGWKDVKSNEWNGYLQSASSSPPEGTWGDGSFDSDQIKNEILPYSQRYWDDQAKVPFLFNRTTNIWISYEDEQSIQWKIDYIHQYQLAGVFFWEMSKNRQGHLIHLASNALIKDRSVTFTFNCSSSSSS